MKVLVTGCAGYIGPILCKMLLENGYDVVGLDTNYFDGCDFGNISFPFRQIRKDIRQVDETDLDEVEAIIHLAALSNDPLGELNYSLTDDINCQSTIKLAKLAKKKGVERFVYASSCSMYGVAGDEALTEEAAFNPVTAYARSKVSSEERLSKLADEQFSPVYLRNSTAYGLSPRMRFDLVLNNLLGWAYTTGKIRIMSDGTPWRPLVHIEDISLACLCCLKAPKEVIHNQAFNVGTNSENYQIKDIADVIKLIVPGCEVEYTYEHGSDSRTYRVNFEKITRMLPMFHPKWNIEKGTVQTYEYIKKRGLDFEEFSGDLFVRLKRLKKLMAAGKLNEKLFWTGTIL